MKKGILEICADSVQSAVNAQRGGADRIELCTDLSSGGLTPSIATIELTRKYVNIPIHVLIRPRSGDFHYSNLEFETMKLDVERLKTLGVDGIVIGALNPEGEIDIRKTKELIELAKPLDITFHRAFDMTSDPFYSMDQLIDLGVNRILSSGQRQTAIEGCRVLSSLITKADDKIVIMPGGGVNIENINELYKHTHAKEYHTSAKSLFPSKMKYQNIDINLHSNGKGLENLFGNIQSDETKVKELINYLHN